MVLRLHFDAMSQPCRALMLFVRANAIPCQEVPVALRKREHLEKKFEAINPFKKVPVLEHDGFKLTESVAILKYLIRTFPTADHWYPKDSQLMARVDEIMAWYHLNLRLNGGWYFQSKVIIPRATGEPPNEKNIARFQTGLENVLGQIEKIWLKENKYIAGKDLSIADLITVTELEQPGMAGLDVKEDHPILAAYMDLVSSRLQPHYDEVHSICHKIRDKALAKNQ